MIRFKHEHMQVYSRRRKRGKGIRMTITQSAKNNIQENPLSPCNTQKHTRGKDVGKKTTQEKD